MTAGPNQRASQAAPRSPWSLSVPAISSRPLSSCSSASGVGAAQVAGVVQQRGGDEGGRRARRPGERRGLQQVLRDGDRLPQVVGGPFGSEQLGQPVYR